MANGLQRQQTGEIKLNYLAFADDIVILANNHKDLQERLNNLYERLNIFGLEIDKCKCAHIKVFRKLKMYFIAAEDIHQKLNSTKS